MLTTDSTVRDVIVVDSGPVAFAAHILATETTLAEHVTVTRESWTTHIAADGDLPYAVWGSGTQALWRLLAAIAYTADHVSLYEVLSRLDADNTAAVGRAFAALTDQGHG